MPKAIKRLKPQVQHFFDTNFFLLDPATLPTLKNVPHARRWVTETVRDEVNEKLDDATTATKLQGHKVLRFDDLYADDPNVCPTFYAYVQAMFSAAVVGSDDFYEELLLSKRIKGVSTEEDEHLYQQLRKHSSSSHNRLPDGSPKPEGLRKLERIDSATRKKIVASIRDGHPAVIRDIKNLALTLYYCLFTLQNVVLYTADADPVSLFLRWLDAMSMRSTLQGEVLKQLGHDGAAHVARSHVVRLSFPFWEFVKKRQRWFQDIVAESYKTAGCRFTIKRWDQNARKFDEDVYITFEREVAHMLARSHDNFLCHFTKNNELGSWLHLRYEWPPLEPESQELLVTVRPKGINYRSLTVSTEEHDRECLYRRTDAAGRLHTWSQFVPADAPPRQ